MSNSTFSPAQLEAYLLHISFPILKYPQLSPGVARTKEGLVYLSLLQRHHLASVPFENVSLHYSYEKILSLDNDDLYQKIVVKNRGGYCMENNQFFGTVLRSLGFEVVSSGARVFGGEAMGGWDHQINLVVIEGVIHLVDVGFGGACPTRPLPLISDHVSSWGVTTTSNRLVQQKSTNSLIQPLWVLQNRVSPTDDWKPLYGFTLTEFFPRDFEVMNYATSTKKQCIFTYKIIVVKMLLDEEGDEVVGTLWLEGRQLKRRIKGETEELRVCKNEAERVKVLREWFGIVLSQREQDGIKRTVTELLEEK